MTTTEKREATKNTQTTSGDFYTVCGHITNSRSLLDLAAEYILNGQDATAEEKLYNILFAVETARDEASTPPPRKIRGSRGSNKRAVCSFMGSVERCPYCKRSHGDNTFNAYVSGLLRGYNMGSLLAHGKEWDT